MTVITIIISVLALGSIIGGILLLKQSARKFNLTKEQLANIKKRNKAIEKQEEKEE
ncbi:MAG: DUF2897 family protein [Colwellia sp.]